MTRLLAAARTAVVLVCAAVSLPALATGPWAAAPAAAHGGKLQIAIQRAGPYELTVFSSPTPLRSGTADVSVAVYRAGTLDFVDDARVTVAARPIDPGASGPAATYPATRSVESRQLLYAADVVLSVPGRWAFAVEVAGPLGAGAVEFEAAVVRSGFLESPLSIVALLALPFAFLAFVAALTILRRRVRRRPRTT